MPPNHLPPPSPPRTSAIPADPLCARLRSACTASDARTARASAPGAGDRCLRTTYHPLLLQELPQYLQILFVRDCDQRAQLLTHEQREHLRPELAIDASEPLTTPFSSKNFRNTCRSSLCAIAISVHSF